MKKKIISLIVAGIIVVPMFGCNNGKEEKVTETNNTVEESNNKEESNKGDEVSDNTNEESDKDEINRKISKDELIAIYDDSFSKFEEGLNNDGLKVSKTNKSQEGFYDYDYIGYCSESSTRVPNEMYVCSMQVGETSNDNNSTACFSILMEYPITEGCVAAGTMIDINEMGFEKYTDIFLPDHQWDYDALNKEINDILKDLDSGHKYAGVFNENGCKVTFSIYPDEIMLKVYSPIYIVE